MGLLLLAFTTTQCKSADRGEKCDEDFDCESTDCIACATTKRCGLAYESYSSEIATFCAEWGDRAPGDPAGTGKGPSGSCGASDVWIGNYDGQATPTCQYACSLSGSQRQQTCQVLGSMLDANPGSFCKSCR